MDSFRSNCVEGLEANSKAIARHLENSLMLVTALNQEIGYDNAAKIAKDAWVKGCTLKESAVHLGLMSEEDFDRHVRPEQMVRP